MAPASFPEYRVLVAPGLHSSGPEHWQSRWQRLYPAFERVEQDDWDHPELVAWSARLDRVRAEEGRPVLIVAHSFGCLTAAYNVAANPHGVAGVLMVAPADPARFGVADALPQHILPCPTIMIGSDNDPWMTAQTAALWAARWGSEFINIGARGHINAESGLGDWLFGQEKLRILVERAQAERRSPQLA